MDRVTPVNTPSVPVEKNYRALEASLPAEERSEQDKIELSGGESQGYREHMKSPPPTAGKGNAEINAIDDRMKGGIAGTVAVLGYEMSGAGTYIHETAHKQMVEHLYRNAQVTVQVDGLDNLKSFFKEPTAANLGHIFSGYDANKDGAAGVTHYTYGDGPSELGTKLGPNGSRAAISAAGCVSTLIPDIAAFAAGFKLRKEHPVAGYTLMTLSGVHHFANSMYPIDAVLPGPKSPGHDWVSFSQATGIHPALTGAVFALSLPALGVGMYMLEKRREEKAKDHEALAHLIASGALPRETLDARLEAYPRKDKIDKLEGELHSLVTRKDSLAEKGFNKEFHSLQRKLEKEYERFSGGLIDEFRNRVDEEKTRMNEKKDTPLAKVLSDSLVMVKDAYQKDKVGTLLEGAGLAGGLFIAGKSVADAVKVFALNSAPATSKVLSALVPGLGVVFTAGAAYKAAKIIKNPQVSLIDKAAAASSAFFTGLTAAASLIPGAGLPLSLAGIAGLVGTSLGRWVAHKVSDS
ncbi:MAG: hypothetical protein RDV48_22380 [Candidatus Eremiobacteraeota bacterium]|nr:hypothetical protein [Candidatus Eremiobacteraeota bacterium]